MRTMVDQKCPRCGARISYDGFSPEFVKLIGRLEHVCADGVRTEITSEPKVRVVLGAGEKVKRFVP